LLLNIQYLDANELHPGRLAFKFEKLSFRERLRLENQKAPANETRTAIRGKNISRKVLAGDHVLVVPRAWGDDPFYFLLPEFSKTGLIIIIGPISDLLHHQGISFKNNFGLHYTAFVNSDTKDEERRVIHGDIRTGKVRFLHIEPESLKVRHFREKLSDAIGKEAVNMVLADAAHCISEWGNPFNPSYLRIPGIVHDLKKRNPGLALLAFTTAAGNIVRQDIMEALALQEIFPAIPESLHRENISHQVMLADNCEEKAAAYVRAVHRDIPAALGCDSIYEVLRRKRGMEEMGLLFCEQAPTQGKYIIKGLAAHYLVEPREIFCGEPAHLRAENSGDTPPEASAQWEYPYYIVLNPALESNDAPEEETEHKALPDIWVTTKRVGVDMKQTQVRFVIHTTLSHGIERWYQASARAGRDGRYAHQVHIAELPNPACEADMRERHSDIPRCTNEGCVFDKENLCDYGKQHLLISETCPGVEDETLRVLEVLDQLISSLENGDDPVQINLSRSGLMHADLPLYRLSVLGIIDTFCMAHQKGDVIFEISGFDAFLDAALAEQGVLAHLQKNDISCHKTYAEHIADHLVDENGEIACCNAQYGPELRKKIHRHIESGKITHYHTHRTLFTDVSDYMAVMLHHIYENMRQMHYQRLWNLKAFLRSETCRGAGLQRHFQVSDANWQCGRCDICMPDLKFRDTEPSSPSAYPELSELEEFFSSWLEKETVPFDPEVSRQFAERFSDHSANIYLRACKILEHSPRNLKALYMAREFSPEDAKGKYATDLMAIAKRTMALPVIIQIYETSPDDVAIRLPQFDTLDDRYGVLNSQEGEAWLYHQAQKLSDTNALPRERLELFGARVVLNSLAGVSARQSGLNQLGVSFLDFFNSGERRGCTEDTENMSAMADIAGVERIA